MKVIEQPALDSLNTFGVSAQAALRIDIESEEDVISLPAFTPGHDLMLGGGSNLLLVSNVPGTVFLNRISGIEIVDETDTFAIVEAGAGENWHRFVNWSLDKGYCGLENLSLIPGCVGAAPMQNIGAYGVELSSVLQSVTAWDCEKMKWRVFDRQACKLAYRDSRFKSLEPDRYLITSVRFALRRCFEPRIEYAGLAAELEPIESGKLTPRQVSDAVIRIRQRKLPDPDRMGNAGSFFKNPVVGTEVSEALTQQNPGLPSWPAGEFSTKLSAAWMIERCGLKGFRKDGAMVSEQHALVLVNTGEATGRAVWRLAQHVRAEVERNFGIALEPEPRIVDFS